MAIARLANSCQVTVTDGDPLAIDLLEQNLNNADNQLDTATIKASMLQWSLDMDQQHEFCLWCRETWNWGQDEAVAFDIVVAGDVLYKDELPMIFFATVRSLLAVGGALYLCHVPRANVDYDMVMKAAATAGFVSEMVDVGFAAATLEEDGCSSDDLGKARMYRIKGLK
jgi:hypothetical protein